MNRRDEAIVFAAVGVTHEVKPAPRPPRGRSPKTLAMAEAYRRGEPAWVIAARFGVKQVTVRQAARRCGEPYRYRAYARK